MKRLRLPFGVLVAALAFAALLLAGSRPAQAQTGPPDLAQFGYPRVTASVMFTPGQAQTLTAGNQQVVLPADFISKTVMFEFLEGDNAYFAPLLPADDQGRPVIANFAFRVTDPATNARIGRFDKPVQWSITDPQIVAGSAVYNTSAANPPVVTDNPVPGTVTGTTLAHPFGGAGVGWLVVNPAPAPGMPTTGNAPAEGVWSALLIGLGALLCLAGGLALRRTRRACV